MKKQTATLRSGSFGLSLALLTSTTLLSCAKEEVRPAAPVQEVSADGVAAVGCPASLPKVPGYPDIACGCYEVPGLAANKQAYLAAGASLNFLASAMMETERMDPKSYPDGDNKTRDAFNAGALKQNWYMMRTSYPAWKNARPALTAADYGRARALNTDRKLDVAVYNAAVKQYGLDRFLAGHRGGQTGLNNPNTEDAKRFIAAYKWTVDRLSSNAEYRTNGIRFWVMIPAIRPSAPAAALASVEK